MTGELRRAELAAALDAVERRLAAACADAGRSRAEVTLVAVTKTRPAEDVVLLAGLGVQDVGESKDQEAAPKAAEVERLLGTRTPPRWHFIGQLQTNKARSAVAYASAVHSVDRPRLVRALSDAAARAGRELDVLLQVRLDDAPGRGGTPVAELPGLAEATAAAEGLRLRGLMGVVPLGGAAEPAFAVLADAAARLRADHPDATWLSAGMSADLEAAVAAGSTHVRIGTALLGHRAHVHG